MEDKTVKFFRKATVSRGEALQGLFKSNPQLDLVAFEKRTAANDHEAKLAKAKVGDEVYVATVRVAEFPPKDEGEETEEPTPPKKKPESGGDEGGGESPDEAPDEGGDEAPDFGSDADGAGAPGEEKGHKMSPEEETVHLLHQILDVLQGGGDPMGPDAGGPPGGDLGLPDVGAPGQGDTLPPPGKAPLPPPVPPKGPMPGGGAFSSVIGDAKDFTFRRVDAHEVNNTAVIAEATGLAPGFRVAKVDRRTEPGVVHVTMTRS